jgi:hypothetical protein
MNNPKYLVNISHSPSVPNGQYLINVNGVTQSMPTYSEELFVASMPEIKTYATGSSYTEALDNLLTSVSSVVDPGNGPLSGIVTN